MVLITTVYCACVRTCVSVCGANFEKARQKFGTKTMAPSMFYCQKYTIEGYYRSWLANKHDFSLFTLSLSLTPSFSRIHTLSLAHSLFRTLFLLQLLLSFSLSISFSFSPSISVILPLTLSLTPSLSLSLSLSLSP